MQDKVDRSLHVIQYVNHRLRVIVMELESFHTYSTLYTYQEDIMLRSDRARSHCFGTPS
jgi:hypothetical protein